MKGFKFAIFVFLIAAASIAYAWKTGDRVLGQWGDGFWYPATITGVEGTNFNVSFDDGDKATLPASKIKAIDWKVGSKVQCNWKRGGTYYPGTITRKNGDSIHISYDDGDQEDATIAICRSR